jgi:Cu(I)/Ag(I) efflux system periplasmic protein CusF
MKTLYKLTLAVVAACAVIAPAHTETPRQASSATKNTGAQQAMTEGEIKKVNKESGKLTIKHGELKNLGMPPMTMVFLVKDKAMLDQVKPGDKVNFLADKVDGKLVVMQLESMK